MIRFTTTLLQPESSIWDESWSYLLLPKRASAKLPTRAMTTVEGTINGYPFLATLEPDGQSSHWLKVNKQLREHAHAEVGEPVTLELRPVKSEPEPEEPADLQVALAGSREARALWSALSPIARRDWIQWITSAKRPETRTRRISNTCDMLLTGKRRVCCFDRSGIFSKSLSAPKAVK